MTSDLYLSHHGVKGMKWGVRKQRRLERKEFNRDVKEYRKIRSTFTDSLQKSVSKHTQDVDRDANTQKLADVGKFVNQKRVEKGQAYVDRMIAKANKQQRTENAVWGGIFIASSVAAMAGVAWLESKYNL